jgi:hypothetical protein
MSGWQVWLLPVLWVVVGGGALAGLIVPPIHHALQQRRERRRCFLTFTGKPFVIQPDDSFDDNAYGQART